MQLTTINYWLSKIGILLVLEIDKYNFDKPTKLYFITKKNYEKRCLDV